MGREQTQGTHHVLGGMGEGGGAEEFGDLVVHFREDVEER